MSDFLQQLVRIIQEPTSNLTAAVLLLAALTLIVLIVIIALLLLVTRPAKPKRRTVGRRIKRTEEEYEYPELSLELAPRLPGEPPPGQKAKPPARSGRWSGWLVALLAVLAVLAGYFGSGGQGYCLDACHLNDSGMSERARAQHKSVSCVACHEDAGAASAPAALAQRAAHLVGRVTPGVHVYAGPVPSRRCLECHGGIASGTIETAGGAVMSHKEPLAAGMACRDCHGEVGHRPVIGVTGMAKCVRCHDSKTASAECRSCHLKDTGQATAARGASRGFPRVQLGPVEDCGGCHDQVSCDKCHGIRMPHTIEFKSYQHARYAGFEKKNVCWRCHPQGDCTPCHSFPGHAEGFKAEHKSIPPQGAYCTCHWPHLPAKAKAEMKNFCELCH